MTRILFVNGKPEEYLQVKSALHQISDNFSVSYVASSDHLFNLLQYFTPDILFIDTCYEHQHGVTCFHKLRANSLFDSLPIFVYGPKTSMHLTHGGDPSLVNHYVVKHSSEEMIRLSLQKELRIFQARETQDVIGLPA